MSADTKRHGEMHQNANFKQFMHLFCSATKVNMIFNVSEASEVEYKHFHVTEKNLKLLYCEARLSDFFPFHFVGFGFGRSDRHSRWAACCDLALKLEANQLLTKEIMLLAENNMNLAKKDERQREWKSVGTRVNSFRTFFSSEKIPSDVLDVSGELQTKFTTCLRKFVRKMKLRDKNAKVKSEEKQEAQQDVLEAPITEAVSGALKRDRSAENDVASPPMKRANVEQTVEENGISEDRISEQVVNDGDKSNNLAENCEEQSAPQNSSDSSRHTDSMPAVLQLPTSSAPVQVIELDDKSSSDSDEDSYISIIDVPEIMGMDPDELGMSFNTRSGSCKQDDSSRKNNTEIGVITQIRFLKVYNQISEYKKRYKREFDQFDKRIWDHYLKNGQNDYTFAWKMRAREMIHSVIRQIHPTSQLVVVGSTLNGCGSFNSDLDMCLCIKSAQGYYDDSRQVGIKSLSQILKHFAKNQPDFLKDVEMIRAKVPILKFYLHPPYDELEIDLNCNNTAGIYNTHLMHHYARIDDRFGALCLLIKHWAIINDIQDAMTGTFNSYSLILMVLHFLQCACSPPVLPNLQFLFRDVFTGEIPLEKLALFQKLPEWPQKEENHQTIGELLIGFFEYYSNFDFENFGISILRGDIFHRTDLPGSSERFKLYVEEPFDGQNTARCITKEFNFNKILTALTGARNAFLDDNARPPSFESIGI